MNVFAKFDKIPSMILQDIKETKRYGHTHGRTDNVKTVYPPTNTVCGGIIKEKRDNCKVQTSSACGQMDRQIDRYTYIVDSQADKQAHDRRTGPV